MDRLLDIAKPIRDSASGGEESASDFRLLRHLASSVELPSDFSSSNSGAGQPPMRDIKALREGKLAELSAA